MISGPKKVVNLIRNIEKKEFKKLLLVDVFFLKKAKIYV